ncbi:unnamed protein product [Cuscuta campestris]|uniref:Uncharacterized protein n=1 Tax=Cuscuta campestris TaxID=132261 RepID=A0A484MRB9_9ASTE|nr:unnamed protein product [Cuscuta campestris]
MGFFDLNIPYLESDRRVIDKKSAKSMRLKLLIKAMELGYTGVAYNRTIKGVMSELDRCSISPFPLSSILKLSPSISSAVKLHRDLLTVPVSAPFRQYTRLTVMVDSPAQASVLNSGNPITKSYDVVAVMPLNQNAFDQACQISQVDVITIDFSQKMLFRLKQPMVKAAVQRGIYFEITYSSLLTDAQARRQMIPNAKLLVDWTRGRNIILTSAAPSVTELRGPHDVVNLSSLLGLSTEHAKSALSKNCRNLIEKASRKKSYYKGAIKVEAISSGDSVEPKFDDWLKWDPISSGDGDLLLDDIDRFFSASTPSSNVKPVDFSSSINGLPPHGLRIRDILSSRQLTPELLNAFQTDVAIATSETCGQGDHNNSQDDSQNTDVGAHNICESANIETDSMTQSLPTDFLIDMDDVEKKREHMISQRISSDGIEVDEMQLDSGVSKSEGHGAVPDNAITISDSSVDVEISVQDGNLTSAEVSVPSENSDVLKISRAEEPMMPGILDDGLEPQSAAMDENMIDTKVMLSEKEPSSMALGNVGSLDDLVEIAEIRDSSVNSVNELPANNSCSNPMQDKNECNASENEVMEDDRIQRPCLSERKCRSRMLHRPFSFPFKQLGMHRRPKRKAQRHITPPI